MKTIKLPSLQPDDANLICTEAIRELSWLHLKGSSARELKVRHPATGGSGIGTLTVWISPSPDGVTLTIEGKNGATDAFLQTVSELHKSFAKPQATPRSREAPNPSVASETSTQKSPGWYPHAIDPTWECFWDGSGWDGSTRPVKQASTAISADPMPSAMPEREPVLHASGATAGASTAGTASRGWIGFLALIALIVIFAIARFMSSAGVGSDDTSGINQPVRTPSSFGVTGAGSDQCPADAPYEDSAGRCWKSYEAYHQWN